MMFITVVESKPKHCSTLVALFAYKVNFLKIHMVFVVCWVYFFLLPPQDPFTDPPFIIIDNYAFQFHMT